MFDDYKETLAMAVLILAACFGLGYCAKVEQEVELLKLQRKQLEATP